MKHYDILVPGSYFCDVIFTDLPRFPSLGTEIYCGGLEVVPGGVLNTVIALRRLGVYVGWIGTIGTDFFSRFVLEAAEREGVATDLLHRQDSPLRRLTVSLSTPEERAFVTYIDPTPSRAELALDALSVATFERMHFTSLEWAAEVPLLLDACRARRVQVSMDCQYREGVTLATEGVRPVLERIDIFMPNLREARQLTGCTDLGEALAVLAEIVPLVVIKDGANGAYAQRGAETFHAPALTFEQVVDTTGAGDAFNAGFLAALMAGEALQGALAWGNFCGGMSTQAHGGSSAAPTRDQVLAWRSQTT
ncbi:MAG: carbohydrate kinase family protein [Chloroflexi bacterium CFX4]|nr:carbohydrate kinase family protein [Chloroflexi bacterium CFX4]MDL1923172.1 carbohydrate kinase family protein [Chloroflexi bacterium CFX3]